jgi:Tol biopolymer transport system component
MLHAIVLLAVLTRVEAASSADSPAEARFREKIVFFGSADGASSLIQTMNPDGTGLRSVLKLQGAISSGRVSPDGRSAAFSLQANGAKHPAVWILEPNGERRQIADKGLVTAWSPDGKSLACYRSERGEWESFLVEISTRMSRQLPSPKGDVVEDWSPDGKTLGIVAGNSQRTFRHSTKGRSAKFIC